MEFSYVLEIHKMQKNQRRANLKRSTFRAATNIYKYCNDINEYYRIMKNRYYNRKDTFLSLL